MISQSLCWLAGIPGDGDSDRQIGNRGERCGIAHYRRPHRMAPRGSEFG